MRVYTVYVDNYYSGLRLAKVIEDRGFVVTFNYKSNRPTLLFGGGIQKEMKKNQRWRKLGAGLIKRNKLQQLIRKIQRWLTFSQINTQ